MKVAALVLGYKEPNWTKQTVDCALRAGCSPVVIIARQDGTGPMSNIFSEGMLLMKEFGVDWVWHLTNVSFTINMLSELLEHVDPSTAAVHPGFSSEHPHLQAAAADGSQVPFVEWTAPLVSVRAWQDVGPLDAKMGYWGFDLDWSYRAKMAGYSLKTCTSCMLAHTYLKKADKAEHPVTTARRTERARHDQATEAELVRKWGKHWLARLWPTHPYVAKKRLYLYRENRGLYEEQK